MQSVPVIVPFTDYSKWQRRPSKRGGVGVVRTARSKPRFSPPQPQSPPKTQATTLVFAPSGPFKHSHGHVRKKLPSPELPRVVRRPVDRPTPSRASPDSKVYRSIAVTHSPRYKLLKAQVEAKRKSVREFQQYKDDLIAANLKLISEIRKGESEINSGVKNLLEKYQKFKGALATLQHKVGRDREEEQEEIERTRQEIRDKVNLLRGRVREAETKLQSKQKEKATLKGYKEKEYLVNQVHIEELREKIKLHAEEYEERIKELEREIKEEKERCQRELEAKRREIEAQATEVYIGKMQRSVKEKAIQNKIMEKEIDLHHHKIEELGTAIEDLRTIIGELRRAIQEDKRRRNPLLVAEKCHPDTELQLNIPVREPLPL